MGKVIVNSSEKIKYIEKYLKGKLIKQDIANECHSSYTTVEDWFMSMKPSDHRVLIWVEKIQVS